MIESYNLICRSKTGFSLSRFDLGKSLGLIRSTSKSPARNRRPAGKRCVEISLRKIFYTTKVVRVGLSTLKIVNSQSGLFVPDSYKTQTSHRKMRHVRCYVSADSSLTHLLVDDRKTVSG